MVQHAHTRIMMCAGGGTVVNRDETNHSDPVYIVVYINPLTLCRTPEKFVSSVTCRLDSTVLCSNMRILTSHWLSAVTVEGDDWASVLQEESDIAWINGIYTQHDANTARYFKALTRVTVSPLSFLLHSLSAGRRGRGDIVVRLLVSHRGEPDLIPVRAFHGFPRVGIVPDDAAGRRVFSRISLSPHACIPALLHTHLNHSYWLSLLAGSLTLEKLEVIETGLRARDSKRAAKWEARGATGGGAHARTARPIARHAGSGAGSSWQQPRLFGGARAPVPARQSVCCEQVDVTQRWSSVCHPVHGGDTPVTRSLRPHLGSLYPLVHCGSA
ncbi:hypothetical protein PR048_003768 [Dryococelus australis]|uniref:Uncharacterized protein n=1 Tax=Dryococelus australis TaxID=614101 RepID=A0ABQ9IP12_9NEOP|nr:hypothetical protein PR048_003768 [Dryococelus australis]